MALSPLFAEAKKRSELLGMIGDPALAPEVMNGPVPSFAPTPVAAPVLNPRIASLSTDPLTNRKDQVEADLYRRQNPIAPTTVLGKIGHTAANVGNVLGEIFAPAATSLISGTRLNNQRKINEDKGDLEDISQLETEAGRRKQTDALTDYTLQRPAIEQSKIDQRQQAVRDRVAQAAASHGQKVSWGEDGTPSYEDDPELLAHAAQKATTDLHAAEAELNQAKIDPNSPLFQQAQAKAAIARANAQAAGIRANAYQGNYLMHAKGLGMNGEALPGIGMLDGTPVGTSVQPTVNKALASGVQFEDVNQGIAHTTDALTKLSNSGGSLSTPTMITALGHHDGGIGSWLQSKAAASLSPEERDAVVSVNAMRERILAMRKASGGNASESQVKRMISMLPGPSTPDLDTAMRQLKEVQSQADVLSRGVPQVNRGSDKAKSEPKATHRFNPVTGKIEEVKNGR